MSKHTDNLNKRIRVLEAALERVFNANPVCLTHQQMAKSCIEIGNERSEGCWICHVRWVLGREESSF